MKPAARPLWERLGNVLLFVLLVAGLPLAYQRAVDGGPDLAGFCDAGRYILDHGTRNPDSTLSRYWPSADVPWMLLCRLPMPVVAVGWYLFGCVAWLGLLRTIRERMLVLNNDSARRHATLAAGLLAMPLVLDGMALGSFHVLMLWLMFEGLDRACRGREVSGGILLGTAAWLKLLPLIGIPFLLLRGRWRPAPFAAATVALLNVVLSVAAFGPAGAWREHVQWLRQGAAGTAAHQLASADNEDEDRLTNQSVAVTLRRLFSSLGSEPGDARSRVRLADLDPRQLQILFLAVMAVLAAGVLAYLLPRNVLRRHERTSRRTALPGRRDGPEGPSYVTMIRAGVISGTRSVPDTLPNQFAMLGLATLWFSPVVWSYHFVAVTPVLAILLLRCRYRVPWVLLVVGVWAGSMALLALPAARAAGVLLWMSLIFGAGLVAFLARPHTDAYEHQT